MKTSTIPLAAAGMLAATAAPAAAQDLQITVTPYFWAAGMEGDMAPIAGLPAVHTDSDFSDIADNLQMGLASSFELRLGRWAVVGDVSYVDIGATAELANPNPLFNSAGFDSKSVMSTMGASWRLMENEYGSSFDVIGGARISWADSDIRLIRTDGTEVRAQDDKLWVDPIVGVRGVAQFTDRWGMIGYADVGGFGISSDITWQALGAVNYRFNDTFALSVGYRYYVIDYEDEGFLYDVTQHGPIIGTVITF